MSRWKIVISDYYYPNLNAEMAEFQKLGDDVEIVDCTKIQKGGIFDTKELIKYARDADALIHQFCQLDAEFIHALEKCKVIARYAIGVDTIDLPAAEAKGIAVANVPDYCISEVANQAAAHILNAVRKIVPARDLLMENRFDFAAIRPMHRTENMTFGLLGFGNIARNLCRKMQPFFGKVIAYDPYFPDTESYPEVAFLSLDEVLAQADVLSVHVPLMPSTRGMLSDSQFNMMKSGVIIVNTARGGLIDEDALLRALESGKVGYAGLDVITGEDFSCSAFLRHLRVTLTPHAAWCSEEALEELQRKVAQNVVSALRTGVPIYPVKS